MTLLYGRNDAMIGAVLSPPPRDDRHALKCIDLFCGIGGFHITANNLGLKVIFASDIDDDACTAYRHNFNLEPKGDIVSLKVEDIPDHDILFAGFPCQPWSIIGNQHGFADPRGTLFFEVVRIVKAKMPQGIVLENVKQLSTAQHGAVLRSMMDKLRKLGYTVDTRVLNALDFGIPQKRERTIIVATLQPFTEFPWPTDVRPMIPLADLLEENPDRKYFVSDRIREKRHENHTAESIPAIWHENKSGHISSHQWSCALRASASYNYLLVDGERRLTPRELLRLQGFPDSFEIVCNDSQTRKQAGNAVTVPLVEAAIKGVLDVFERSKITRRGKTPNWPISVGANSRTR